MTADDRAALYQPYNQCLADNGVTSDNSVVAKQQADVVTQTCQPLYPLPPWEYDPNNPAARDFVDAVIACLRKHGVKYVEAENDPTATRLNIAFGGPDNDQDSITKGLQFTPECETEASATK
jgi:hypothetical protein